MTYLLLGHGPFETCLLSFERVQDNKCNNCGKVDTPVQKVIECSASEGVRTLLRNKCAELSFDWPLNLADLMANKETAEILRITWREVEELKRL